MQNCQSWNGCGRADKMATGNRPTTGNLVSQSYHDDSPMVSSQGVTQRSSSVSEVSEHHSRPVPCRGRSKQDEGFKGDSGVSSWIIGDERDGDMEWKKEDSPHFRESVKTDIRELSNGVNSAPSTMDTLKRSVADILEQGNYSPSQLMVTPEERLSQIETKPRSSSDEKLDRIERDTSVMSYKDHAAFISRITSQPIFSTLGRIRKKEKHDRKRTLSTQTSISDELEQVDSPTATYISTYISRLMLMDIFYVVIPMFGICTFTVSA